MDKQIPRSWDIAETEVGGDEWWLDDLAIREAKVINGEIRVRCFGYTRACLKAPDHQAVFSIKGTEELRTNLRCPACEEEFQKELYYRIHPEKRPKKKYEHDPEWKPRKKRESKKVPVERTNKLLAEFGLDLIDPDKKGGKKLTDEEKEKRKKARQEDKKEKRALLDEIIGATKKKKGE